ncbi:unnamed protein product [Sphagnum balticum]
MLNERYTRFAAKSFIPERYVIMSLPEKEQREAEVVEPPTQGGGGARKAGGRKRIVADEALETIKVISRLALAEGWIRLAREEIVGVVAEGAGIGRAYCAVIYGRAHPAYGIRYTLVASFEIALDWYAGTIQVEPRGGCAVSADELVVGEGVALGADRSGEAGQTADHWYSAGHWGVLGGRRVF